MGDFHVYQSNILTLYSDLLGINSAVLLFVLDQSGLTLLSPEPQQNKQEQTLFQIM